MTVHRLPGEKRGNVSPSLPVRAPGRGRQGELRSLSDYPYLSYQAPGTPGSNLSETTGYYSTQSTSLPSVCSAAISPMGADLKTSQSGFENRDVITGSTQHMKPVPSQTSTSQHSGYETDQTSFETSFQTSSGGGSALNQTFPSRPNDIPPYTIRPLYSTGSNGNSNRVRMSSHSSYGGSSQMSSQIGSTTSPKPDAALSVRPPYPPPRTTPSTTTSPFAANAHSFSVDRLESYGLPRVSGDGHMTSLAPHSMSLSSVCRLGGGKRTNV